MPGFPGLLDRLFNDLVGDSVYFDVDLNGCNAFLGPGDLKVHIPEEVLEALNVGHGDEAVPPS
jgi:hypothetical protein